MKNFWIALLLFTPNFLLSALAVAQSVEPPRRTDGVRSPVNRAEEQINRSDASNGGYFEKIDQELQTLQKSIDALQRSPSTRQVAPAAKPNEATPANVNAAAPASASPEGSPPRSTPQFFEFKGSKSPTQTLVLLLVSGIMGMVGQGGRTIIGLKKLSDKARTAAGEPDEFSARRLAVGLMIGFVAGVAGGLTPKVFDAPTMTSDTLFYLASIGYMGVDVIEGFMNTVTAGQLPKLIAETATVQRISESPKSDEQTPSSYDLAPTRPAPPPPHSSNDEINEGLQYSADISAASQMHGFPEEYIYGIGSRESLWGLALHPTGPSGTGDWAPRNGRMPTDGLGWGRGLMQIDYASHPFAQTGNWRDPSANISYGTNILGQNLDYFRRANYPGVDPLRAAIAAYNCGIGNVERAIREGDDVDAKTTGRNYSADVLRRAEMFKPYVRSSVA